MSRVLKSQSVLEPFSESRILVQTAVAALTPEAEPTHPVGEAMAIEVEPLLLRAEEQYRERIASAEQQAQTMIEEAARQIDDQVQAAREVGHVQGLEQGRAEAMQACAEECQQRIEQAQAVVAEAQQARKQLLCDMHHTLTRITMDAVQTVIRRELVLQPADIDAIVSELLEYVMDGTRIEVRVHPADFPLATAAHPKWNSAKFGEWEVAVVPDSTLAEGGCEIRSELGRVDSRVETKLALMEEAIRDAMERGIERYEHDHS